MAEEKKNEVTEETKEEARKLSMEELEHVIGGLNDGKITLVNVLISIQNMGFSAIFACMLTVMKSGVISIMCLHIKFRIHTINHY